jgi:hypothetical protein
MAWFQFNGHKGPVAALYIRTERARTHFLLHSSILPQPEFDPRFLGLLHCSLIINRLTYPGSVGGQKRVL